MKVHSIVDIITNSSSVIYTNTYSGSKEYAEKLIARLFDLQDENGFEIHEEEVGDFYNCLLDERVQKSTIIVKTSKGEMDLSDFIDIFWQEGAFDG